MEGVAAVFVVVLAVFVVALAIRLAREASRVVVFEHERGLRFHHGRFVGVVEPGAYRHWRSRSTIKTFDLRPTVLTMPGQEVISADGVSIRISLAARYAVVDPVAAFNESEDYFAALYLALQVALRNVVSATKIDDLLERRADVGPQVLEGAREAAAQLGLRLDSVEAKDFMLQGELRKAFAQVVTARKEGLAALERARGETAALRNLANAARVLESSPALMQLRVLQQIGGSAGNTVVLGLSGATTPLPLRGAGEETPPAELPPLDR